MQVSPDGCEGGSEIGAEKDKGTVTGTVSIADKCYDVITDPTPAEYVSIGTIMMDECESAEDEECRISECQDPTAADKCNEEVAECTMNEQGLCEGIQL